MRVGYVGLGAMGRALAGHLVGRFGLVVLDLSPAAVQAFVDQGAEAASSAVELATRCDVVILCLPRSSDVEAVLFGPEGLAQGLVAGSIVIDQTSGVPTQTRGFADRLASQGVAMLDAPVAGGVPLALTGAITIMASGPAEAYERALPVLQAISPKVFRCSGRVGDGQAVKIVNNMINAANRIATLEIVAVGRKLGLSMAAMTNTLNDSPARSFITTRLLPAIVENRSSTDFALSLMVKDLDQAAALGADHGAPMPISGIARGVFQMALNILGPTARLDDMVGFMETATQTRLRDGSRHANVGETVPQDQASALIVGALAACERLIVLENAAVAARVGIKMCDLAPVINSGSGWTGQSLDVLPALATNAATTTVTLGETLDTLDALIRHGAANGVPMLITKAARATYEVSANAFGLQESQDAVARHYEAQAAVVFRDEPDPVGRFG